MDDDLRYGGAMADVDDSSEAKNKAEERERKKAEVRKRLEESGKLAKKAKKGFLTPDRKKKLRKLLMVKAAEELKQQQLKKDQERANALASRCPKLPDVEGINDKGQLEKIYNDMFERLKKLEEEKYDINQLVVSQDEHINSLSIRVNDLRGKFVKPTLKKVSKYDNKFKKFAESAETKQGEKKPDFRGNLKATKKENVFTQISNKKKAEPKPDWTRRGKEDAAPKEEAKKADEPKPEPAKEEEAPAAEQPVEESEVEEEEEEEDEE